MPRVSLRAAAVAKSRDWLGLGFEAKHKTKLRINSTMKKLLSFATALFVAASVFAGEYPDISIKELKAAIESKKVTVIDVNGTDSWKKGHIPTAIDFAKNKETLAKVLPKDKDALVVAYCGGPT